MLLALLLLASAMASASGDEPLDVQMAAVRVGHLAKYSNYTEYVRAQRSKTDLMAARTPHGKLIPHQSVPEAYVARLSAYIQQTLPLKHKFALCHGTRSGREQSWFRKYLPSGVEVWGTEISEAAAKVAPYTIAWDYHKVKPEWRGRVDFVYSNTLDHSFNPMLALRQWMSEVSDDGALFIEWSAVNKFSAARRAADAAPASPATTSFAFKVSKKYGYVVDPFAVEEPLRDLPRLVAAASSEAIEAGTSARGFHVTTTLRLANETHYNPDERHVFVIRHQRPAAPR